MSKVLPLCLIAASLLTGCKAKPAGGDANTATASNDPVEMKLQELAGAGARNCGHLKSQMVGDLDASSRCALDASKAKTPFYVEYELPGMNVAVAGNSQGKLFSVQSQTGGTGLTSADCPAELRVAPSGRVTCYAPGTFPMGGGSHSNMSMPPAMGAGNPHGGADELPPGHPKPKPAQKPATPPNQ